MSLTTRNVNKWLKARSTREAQWSKRRVHAYIRTDEGCEINSTEKQHANIMLICAKAEKEPLHVVKVFKDNCDSRKPLLTRPGWIAMCKELMSETADANGIVYQLITKMLSEQSSSYG